MVQNNINLEEFCQESPDDILHKLESRLQGLTTIEALERKRQYGENILPRKRTTAFQVFLKQFMDNPLILILAAATFVSFLLGDRTSSFYIFGIILVSLILGFGNEYAAEKTIEDLLKRIKSTALAMRDGAKVELPSDELTIGDIVVLAPGTIFPADVRLLEVNDLEIDESALTGESRTVFKIHDPINSAKNTSDFKNIGFMGTSVQSGSGIGVVVQIGKQTQYGQIVQSTSFVKPMTEFQKGLASFGQLIIKVVIVLTMAIFVVNAFLGHPILSSLLFALAIAVGLTPELLPVIVTVSLSHGAGRLAKKHVVVKQLISIENLGNIDVLCTDKTGTLTEGTIQVVNYQNRGQGQDLEILKLGLLCNSALVHHKATGNGIDVALWEYALDHNFKIDQVKKLEDTPFDFARKAMFTVVVGKDRNSLIAKGAPEAILTFCGNLVNKKALEDLFVKLARDGLRVVAVAKKEVNRKDSYSWDDVTDLSYQGYITFLDTPKRSAKQALAKLERLQVAIKIVTGDNELVTQKISQELGMETAGAITGEELEKFSPEEFRKVVNQVTIFARVNPDQKLRIIQTLRDSGHTVAYLGDGINDIPSLHSSDVGISVNSAVDVAKEAASVVLLRKDLEVIAQGIAEGRKTFNNTIKYILMATSSNFGNMFSAAGASFFLPFLPMTPVQILLNNTLYDLTQTAIPSDNVDSESLLKPRHWDIHFIRNYMLYFGPLSSIFDYTTFGILLLLFHARDSLFQTGWFIESIATQVLVVFVIRTARSPFFRSQPSKWLLVSCLTIVGLAALIPFTPLASHLGLTVPPVRLLGVIGLEVIAYLTLVELVKNIFLRKYHL